MKDDKNKGEEEILPLSQHPLMTELKKLVGKLPPERRQKLIEELESGELEGDQTNEHGQE